MVTLYGQVRTLNANMRALEGGLKYAFKASLDPSIADSRTKCFGRFTTNVPIPYSIISINENSGYNPSLGIYTALQSGVYAFSYSVYSRSESILIHKVVLMKNNEAMVIVKENNRDDKQDSGSQTLTLHLQKGDQVYVMLVSGRELCGELQYNVFTGYMLYPDIDYAYSAEDLRFLSHY
ncbi:cerebellin 18 [Synchiropus splendidus]|uniref:cerebellin 18 n=1 Tax=Synchiropus splendidus TaxID=270530 RepID=UPI00237E4FEF|nr:cerebellin 18 [Synchiropus splendidus]